MRIAVIATQSSAAAPAHASVHLEVVTAEVDVRGAGSILCEQSSGSDPLARMLDDLQNADAVVSHSARRDAVALAQHDQRVLSLDWRCSTAQWPWFQYSPASIDDLCAAMGIAAYGDETRRNCARSLYGALTSRTGKTDRSKTFLSYLLEWGAWPVFSQIDAQPTVRAITPAIFSRVFVDTLLKCTMTTEFQLWSRPDIEVIIGYPRKGRTEGKLPSAFQLLKSENTELGSRVDSGESLCMIIRGIRNDCFELELAESDYVYRAPPSEA